ncbi:MAG: hypothetical protein ACO1QB_03875, partial [Verrucomicrobiales bacterium]
QLAADGTLVIRFDPQGASRLKLQASVDLITWTDVEAELSAEGDNFSVDTQNEPYQFFRLVH